MVTDTAPLFFLLAEVALSELSPDEGCYSESKCASNSGKIIAVIHVILSGNH